MINEIEKEYPFINIEAKGNLYFVFGYFGQLMFVGSDLKEIYKILKEMFK